MKSLNKIKTSLFVALMTLITSTTFTSCLDNDNSGIEGYEVATLVTYDGNVESKARFTIVPEGDAPTKTLIADMAISNEVPVGQRMVVRYIVTATMSEGYLSQIALRGYTLIPTVKVENVASNIAQSANAEIEVNAINRTGKYINVESYVKNYPKRNYTIYADETTLDNPMPDLYITTSTEGEYTGIKQVDLASFDVSMIWSRIDCEGIKIHINNTSPSGKKVYEFKK